MLRSPHIHELVFSYTYYFSASLLQPNPFYPCGNILSQLDTLKLFSIICINDWISKLWNEFMLSDNL